MSVTRPTGKPEPLDDPLVVLVVPLAAAPPVPVVVVVVVVLLLLPHAASPRASAAVARATRPIGLILPVTCISFPTGLNGQP
jgi:hypothetical protein